jgi:hypothetical protein
LAEFPSLSSSSNLSLIVKLSHNTDKRGADLIVGGSYRI